MYANNIAPVQENGGCLHNIKSMSLIKTNVAKKMLIAARGKGSTIVKEASKPGELPPLGLMFS